MFTALARLATRRPGPVLLCTLIALVGAAVVGMSAFGKLESEGFDDPRSDSSIAADLVEERFGGAPNLLLLVTAAEGDVDDPAVAAAGQEVATELAATPGVTDVVSYWAGATQLRSDDGRHALVLASVTDDAQADVVEHYEKRYEAMAAGDGPVIVRPGGGATVGEDINNQVSADIATAESIAIPVTLVLLVIAFSGVVAALLPLGVGLIAILGGFAFLSVVGGLTDVSIFAVNLVTALGLGLGIDYALLMVSRFREELAAGRGRGDAVAATVRSAGRTILFSGATVIVALAVMLLFPPYFLRSMAYAGIAVTLVAVLVALVVLPAVLMLLGTRVNALRVGGLIGFVRRRRARAAAASGASGVSDVSDVSDVSGVSGAAGAAPRETVESPFWRRVATMVMRRPVLTGVPLLALLFVLGAPFLHVDFGTPDDRVLRPDLSSRAVGDVIREDFSSSVGEAINVVLTGPDDRLGEAAVADFAAELSTLDDVARVESAAGIHVDGRQASPAGPASARFVADEATYLQVLPSVDPASERARELVGEIRALAPPAGTEAFVGGSPAILVDGRATIADRLPLAIGLIALATFVLLFLFTGSVVLPLKAILLNGLVLVGVLGVCVWIFQDGHLAGLLDFTPGSLDTSIPVLLFCIAFGLSMDYEVFLLSRIKEAHDAGMPNTEAVATGLARTGRIVTTAAALLAVTFIAFGTSSVRFIQMFGVGTALAILLDATLIRGVLVPAFMRVAGDLNWWAPKPLRALHRRIGLSEGGPAPVPAPRSRPAPAAPTASEPAPSAASAVSGAPTAGVSAAADRVGGAGRTG